MSELKRQFLTFRPSSANGTLLPSLCALVLLAIATAQLLMTGDVELPEAAQPPAPFKMAAMPQLGAGTVPTILSERPIFSPSRTAGAGGSNASAAGPLGPAIVAGAVIIRGRAHAILQEAGGAIRRLPAGASYNGWQLVGLTREAAIFTQSGKRVPVPFGRAPAPSSAAAQPAESEGEQ